MEIQENETDAECIKKLKVQLKDYREKLAKLRQSVQSCLTVKEEELDWKSRYENLKNAIQACIDLSLDNFKIEPQDDLGDSDPPLLSETNQNGNSGESTDDWKRVETHPINEINQQNATSTINEASQQNEANPKTVTNQKSQQISDYMEIKAEYEDFSTIDHDHAYQAIPDSEEDLEELFLQLENNVNTLKNSNRLDNRNSHDNINNNGDNLVEEREIHVEDHELEIEDHEPDMEGPQPALDEIEPEIEVEVLELNATIG